MNISSDMNNITMQAQGQRPQQQALTDVQKQTVNDILSNYDSESITQDDFLDIFSQFEEAGIPLGESHKSVVEDAGFNFDANIQQSIADGTMPPPPDGNRPPPPPQSSSSSTTDSNSSQLAELLTAFKNGNADQSDIEAFIQSIQDKSSQSTGNIVNNVT
jgi:hypothetical protein